ncbi:hypothetical protein ABH930_000565 [Kitasatospora sp. GAS204A]|nr:hypothetical protein [Kitasatospora sp. GAS204B]
MGWDFEYTAGRVMAQLTGEHVILQDDGSSHSMPDIRIEYADGRVGFGECWMDLDQHPMPRSPAVSPESGLRWPTRAAAGSGQLASTATSG